MNRKHVGVNRDGRVLQIDQHFDHAVIFARGKSEQRMIVEPQVIENFLQGVGVWHGFIVFGGTAPARSRAKSKKGGRPQMKALQRVSDPTDQATM